MQSRKYDEQALGDKREGFRVRIRKQHHNKMLRERRWLLLAPDSECQLLIKIDCNQLVHFLQSTPLVFPEGLDELTGQAYQQFLARFMEYRQHISDLTLYATSTHYEHIFESFSENLVDVLLELAQKLYCLRTENPEVSSNVVKMFNGVVWTLCNYIGSGRDLVSSRYLELMLHALQNPNQTMKGNILASLGTLSEHPQFLQMMLDANILSVILSEKVPQDTAVYFLMKALDNIPFATYRPYLPQILQMLTQQLYESRSVKEVKNTIQAYGCILKESLISQYPQFVIAAEKEIVGLQDWLLKERQFDLTEDQKNFQSFLPKGLDLIDKLYIATPVEEFEDEYNQFILNKVFAGTSLLIMRYAHSTHSSTRQKANSILENACASDLLAEQMFYCRTDLVDYLFATLTPAGSKGETYDVIKSCLLAVCNLCQVCLQNDIMQMIHRRSLIELLRERLNMHEDADLNLKLLITLGKILDIGRLQKEEMDLFENRLAKSFEALGGLIPLTKMFEHNNEEVCQLAMNLHDKYFANHEDEKLQAEP